MEHAEDECRAGGEHHDKHDAEVIRFFVYPIGTMLQLHISAVNSFLT